VRKQLFILLLALVLPILAACTGGGDASPSASGGGASTSASASGSASGSPRASASSSAPASETSPTPFATESAGASASASASTGTGGTTETETADVEETTDTGAVGGADVGATDEATIDETVAADETDMANTGGVGATATADETADTGVGTGTTATADETTTAGAVGGGAGGAGGETIRVGLVTDVGKINDGTFNQFAYEGLQRAEQELGVQIDFIETQQPTDYETNLTRFAEGDYDLVIGVGFLMGDALQAVATRNPDVNFAIVDYAYETPPANVKGLVFQEDQAGYLAGAMASLVSQSRIIGVVGGIEDVPAVRKFVQGYRAGAEAIATTDNSTIDVRQVYIPSFTDAAQGSEAARSQIAEGADVIFGAGGQTGSGAIQAAAQDGAYVIGVDQDEFVTTFRNGSVEGADRIITSAIKRVDNAVFDTVRSVVEGNFTNELYVGNAANQGIGYAPAHNATSVVTQEVINRIDDILEGLANGSIQTGVEQ